MATDNTASVESPQQRYVVPKVHGAPICPIFGRILVLTVTLVVCAFVAMTWYCEGIMWIYDPTTNSWPIYDCPSLAESFKIQNREFSGRTCRMAIAYNYETAYNMQKAGITVPYGTKPEDALERCILPHESEDDIMCYSVNQCTYMCRTADTNENCPYPGTINKDTTEIADNEQCNIYVASQTFSQTVDCYKVEVGPFCGRQFRVTPSNILVMRGIIVATVFMIVFWFISEFGLRATEKGLKQEQAEGKARMDVELPAKRKFLREQVEQRWADEARYMYSLDPNSSLWGGDLTASAGQSARAAGSVVTPTVNSPMMSTIGGYPGMTASEYSEQITKGGFKSRLESRDPRKRFESSAWQRRIEQYRTLGKDKKARFVAKEHFRTLLLNGFFIILIIVSQFCILYFSPQNMHSQESLYEAFVGVVSIWNAVSALDWIIFLDVLLDVVLFFAAACVVKWPKPPVFSRHMQEELKETAGEGYGEESVPLKEAGKEPAMGAAVPEAAAADQPTAQRKTLLPLDGADNLSDVDAGSDFESEDSATVDFVLEQAMTGDVCLLIACHNSAMTEERYDVFTGTLRAALMVFPPTHIFVCDNGRDAKPFDETQWATQQVHPDINYLFVPEGNKTFAFYWCNKYWIPFLHRCGRVPAFKYAVIIDDDVPLPADLHIPHQMLDQNPNIKAVHFPITATTPDGHPNQLVRCQDVEYKLAAVHKLFQATLARSLSCHGAIALWDRQTMDEVFYEHDTVFNGEDLYMGLSLLRRRDDSKIISAPQTIVPTYAPDTWSMLYRQRVKSWDVTSHKKTFTYLYEILTPRGWFHLASWVLKPYFIQEFLTIILDWLRAFLLGGLIIRDWITFVIMLLVFTALLYIMVLVFYFIVLRDRKDIRPSVMTVILFPWYRLSSLLFRLGALCQNLLIYSHERKGIKIGVREDEIRDIPPCPPHPDVDWFTVWTLPEDDKKDEEDGNH
ncbi:hypothetical protein FOZ61_008430 [Perkinsus olseni]|uniref:Glycosyltransferase 2-like domain-containing protein n=1 Tax=Perkinsus olseni TaxID=32597 RepID=A0A7J6L3V2_PEROL|nr:hypothetical protein FOZ61_008430 [Perkinsus olseni]